MAYTDIDKSDDYFNTVTYVANQTDDRQITVGFQPDWTWLKDRDQAVNHDLYDSVRGATKSISSNNTSAEITQADGLKSFNSTGFTLGTGWGNQTTGDDYVSWNWLAGGTASSNSDGSITSNVSANTTSGFSIVSYTGTGSDGATVGHGLGATPACIIIKNRIDSSSAFWCVYHQKSFVSQSDPGVLYLNDTSARSADTNVFGLSTVTIDSDVFSLGNYNVSNGSSDNMIAYCFAEKKGFSKFGSYTGNGNADGPFVYTGFKPAWVLQKNIGAAQGWQLQDNKRLGYNPDNYLLQPNTNQTESALQRVDLLSNGFKVRTTDAGQNSSGTTYIYMAFAENPFATSTGIAGTAR